MPFKDKEKQKEYFKDYYKKNKKSINKRAKENPNRKENNKKYHNSHKEQSNERSREWNEFNKDRKKELNRKQYLENKEIHNKKANEYNKKRKSHDPLFKLTVSIRRLISTSIKRRGYKKNSKTEKILGISFNEFKIFIESKFKEGMTWENYGEWHLDHIIPISISIDESDIYNLNNYKNFQPLWAFENLSKSNKII